LPYQVFSAVDYGKEPPPVVSPCGGLHRTVRYCQNDDLLGIVLESAPVLVKQMESIVQQWKVIGDTVGNVRRDVWLLNYIEFVVNSIVGPAEVRSLLHDFASC
jgi:hypothetical protein